MIIFRKVETFGGICSMLAGGFCAAIAVRDFKADESIWRVWVVVCLVLLVNGVAMVRHVRPLAVLNPEEEGSTSIIGSLHAESLPGDAGRK